MYQSTAPDSEQQRSEIELLRRRLMNVLPDIDNQPLWLGVSKWLQATADTSHQGSLESQVRGELADLKSDPDHKMFPHVGVDQPEDAFPDRCEGCEHYGKHCPILADRIGGQHLKRAYDVSTSDDELASNLFEIASQYGCGVIKEIVSERRGGIEAQKRTGHELYQRAIVHVKGDWDAEDVDLDGEIPRLDDASDEAVTDTDGEGGTPSAPGASGGGGMQGRAMRTEPPEEVRGTVERVSAAVDTRNQADDEGEAD
ncbi:hypothetical protein [Halorubellus salinus]|uniref:hypothetical protein n=1 Tax=Halorubellus salinus TaxID=755309 RepID=UPI001D07F97E|nr:hypothetical protein [Halorubellus salinus]